MHPDLVPGDGAAMAALNEAYAAPGQSGSAAPRRARKEGHDVPTDLRAVGITAREVGSILFDGS